jgi:carotenoid cleavage dioxygenase-like enzyme
VADFPVIHPARVGRPFRFAYAATADLDTAAEFDGIAKFDLQLRSPDGDGAAAEVLAGKVRLPPGCRGGEAFFVPRAAEDASAAEDDGFLLVYVHKEGEASSRLHVYDAATMASEPLAVVRLPQRVPFGFHSTWLTAAQLKAQTADAPVV